MIGFQNLIKIIKNLQKIIKGNVTGSFSIEIPRDTKLLLKAFSKKKCLARCF